MATSLHADSMTTQETSRVLEVSTRQVQRLVETGELAGVGRVGRSLLIDASSVNRLRANGAQRGRPWNQRTVWRALELLAGRTPDQLTSSQRWHLCNRLRRMTAADLVRLGRRRASVSRYRMAESFAPGLRGELVLTGTAALTADPGSSTDFGLAVGGSARVDGYIAEDEVARLVAKYLLVNDEEGNLVLRAVDDMGETGLGRRADTAVIALDLAESVDPRERAAGRRVLDRLLSQM